MKTFFSIAWLVLAWATPALAWEPFRSTNDDVERGNERLRANDANGALQSYDRAARALPNEAGVQLNRGLALLAANDLAQAREALLRATDPQAPRELRADAYYDLGLAFYREGDALAATEDHQGAQAQFREAVDAFRRSLRLRPGDRQTAWNLELALRRIREEQERQEQQEQEQQEQQDQQQDQQQQDQQQQDQQQQDQQQQDQQQQDQQQQDQQQQDQQQQDQQQQDQQQQDQQQQDQQQQDQQQQDQQQQDQQQQDQQQQDQQQQDQQQQDQQQQDQQDQQQGEDPNGQRLPGHVERVLDALQDDEQSLERMRAHARAARERRQPSRDW
jgi:Ca-activated chloride channel family protein